MSALDIPPHPRRTARLALGVLALIAMAGFTQGMLKQLAATAPPAPLQAPGSEIAEARAISPTLQIAEAPRPRAAAPAAAEEAPAPPADLQAATAEPAPAAPQAQPAPAADAAATAPEPPAPAAPASPPENPPT